MRFFYKTKFKNQFFFKFRSECLTCCRISFILNKNLLLYILEIFAQKKAYL